MAPIHKQGRYTLEERGFIMRSFEEFKTLNDHSQRVTYAFQRVFPGSKVPSKSTVYRICEKFKQKFTVQNLHQGYSGRKRSVFTEATKARAEALLEQDRNTWYLIQQALFEKIIWTCLNLLGVGWCRRWINNVLGKHYVITF